MQATRKYDLFIASSYNKPSITSMKDEHWFYLIFFFNTFKWKVRNIESLKIKESVFHNVDKFKMITK